MSCPSLSLLFVVYPDEIPEALFLLESVKAFYAVDSLSHIYIVTQENESSLEQFIRSAVESHFAEISEIVRIVKQKDIIGKPLTHNGWFLQQLLKLKVASLADSDYVLILDCKNHFINPTNTSDFFCDKKPLYRITNESGKFSSTWSATQLMSRSFVNSFALFGLDHEVYIDKALGSLTPFLFNTAIVAELIHYLERRYLENFADLFLHLNVAEFYLYTAYLHYSNQFDDEVAPRQGWVSGVIWENNIQDVAHAEWCRSRISENKMKLFGIHKRAYGRMSQEVIDIAKQIWIDKSLPFDRYGFAEKIFGGLVP